MSKRISWESIQPWPVYLTAAMLPVSLAATNLAKVLMLVFTLVVLVQSGWRHERLQAVTRLRTPLVIALMLAALALSLTYTIAPLSPALHALNKYSKLLIIPMALVLLRERRQAVTAISVYVVAETFVVLSSCLLTAGLNLPWVIKPISERMIAGTVFSSYLDQSMMTAGLAALAWHLRAEFPGRHGPRIAMAVVALCVVNVMLMLPGRSAQVALVAAFALALAWAVPRRYRAAALLAPLLLITVVMSMSPHFRSRIDLVVDEAVAYTHGDRRVTSTGIRLNRWERSLEAVSLRPLTGHGVGSWNDVYARLDHGSSGAISAGGYNPHQEYLLWGVHLGVGGILLLLAFVAVLVWDARPFRTDIRHATWSMVAILAIVCLFNATLFDALIGDYFCFMLAVLLALGTMDRRREETA